jgi:hypothetical protein
VRGSDEIKVVLKPGVSIDTVNAQYGTAAFYRKPASNPMTGCAAKNVI